MAIKVGINGFGRIGRQVTKALFERYRGKFDLVAVNDSQHTSPPTPTSSSTTATTAPSRARSKSRTATW
jgi:glyceraldehyde-3-phosphate dehydrogenase/erythrose-4-phosphate dehydrogenase